MTLRKQVHAAGLHREQDGSGAKTAQLWQKNGGNPSHWIP